VSTGQPLNWPSLIRGHSRRFQYCVGRQRAVDWLTRPAKRSAAGVASETRDGAEHLTCWPRLLLSHHFPTWACGDESDQCKPAIPRRLGGSWMCEESCVRGRRGPRESEGKSTGWKQGDTFCTKTCYVAVDNQGMHRRRTCGLSTGILPEIRHGVRRRSRARETSAEASKREARSAITAGREVIRAIDASGGRFYASNVCSRPRDGRVPARREDEPRCGARDAHPRDFPRSFRTTRLSDKNEGCPDLMQQKKYLSIRNDYD
jgi:hypothetical protein